APLQASTGPAHLSHKKDTGRKSSHIHPAGGYVVIDPIAVVEGDHETTTHIPPAGQAVEQLRERDDAEVLLEEVAVVAERSRRLADAVKQHDHGSVVQQHPVQPGPERQRPEEALDASVNDPAPGIT